MVTILSSCVSTNTLTKPCIAVPVMDRRSGAILVCTTFTHQTMLWINKLLSPTVVLLTLSPRGTQLVIVHFLPEKASSLRLILKCFTRQRLEAQIILAYFKFLVSGATEKAGVRRVGSGRENWRERPCFVLFFLPGRSHWPRAWNRLLIIFWHCYCRVIDSICRRRKLSKIGIGACN